MTRPSSAPVCLVALSGLCLAARLGAGEGDGPEGTTDTLIPWCESRACDSLVVRAILDSNGMTQVPVEFGENERTTWLSVSGIRVLPREIGRLKRLEYLSISGTRLTALPPEIGQLPVLEDLWIDFTGLETLPEAFGDMRSLEHARLQENALTSLPASIGRLSRVWQLELDFNLLASLPESIGDMEALTDLSLRDNRLESLPSSLMKLPLDHLLVQVNRLCVMDAGMSAWLDTLDWSWRDHQDCP